MKVAVVQFCPKYKNKDTNIQTLLNNLSKTDAEIIIFPELCTTGYLFYSKDETMKFAETLYGDTVSLMQKKASELKKIIVFGFIEKDKERVFNSAVALFPNSNLSKVYRKTHLFYKERFCFEPGDTGFWNVYYPEFDINIGLMICYDWRFPEAARTLGLLGVDLIACPSNLVTDVWHLAMPARSLENKVYLAVANRTGIEKNEQESLLFKGESGIWSYNGKILARAGASEEIIIEAEIEPEQTRNKSFNEYNNIFTDRRPEMYNL